MQNSGAHAVYAIKLHLSLKLFLCFVFLLKGFFLLAFVS